MAWGIINFLLSLAGKLFKSQTYHQFLAYLNKIKYENNRIIRCRPLQDYDYRVQAILGKEKIYCLLLVPR